MGAGGRGIDKQGPRGGGGKSCASTSRASGITMSLDRVLRGNDRKDSGIRYLDRTIVRWSNLRMFG